MLRALRARKTRRHAQLKSSAFAAAYDILPLEQRMLLSTGMVASPLALFGTVGDGGGDRIGGVIFYDNHNADPALTGSPGIRTGDDDGIPNVEIDLTNNATKQTQNVVSNNGSDPSLQMGGYLFSDLPDGTYTLTVVTPPTYNIGPIGAGPNRFANSVFSQVAAGGTGASTVTVTVTGGNADLSKTENCGMFTSTDTPPFIGGIVFNDANANGLIDKGETGIGGVTVNLLYPNGNVALSTTTSNGNNGGNGGATTLGQYSFIATQILSLNPPVLGNDITVQFVIAGSNFQFISNKEVNNSPTVYSWADTITGETDPILVAQRNNAPAMSDQSDTAQTDVDCGFFRLTVTLAGPLNAVNDADPNDPNTGINRPLTGTTNALFSMEITPLVPVQEFVPWNTLDGVGEGGGTALGATIDPALAGIDYTANSGVLQFPVSTIPEAELITISVTGYIGVVNDRDFIVQGIAPPGFIKVPNPLQVQCIILNTSFPQATIGNATEVRPTATTADLLFDVSLTAPVGFIGAFTAAPFDVDVNFNTADFSGKQPTDYTTVTGTVTFTPPNIWATFETGGPTSNGTVTFTPPNGLTMTQAISVPVTAGTNPQLSKQFHVLVDTSFTSTVGTPAFGVGTIQANTLPQLSIAGSSVTESLLGFAQLPFTITLDPGLPTPVTVDYATSDGTAVAGVDYVPTSGSTTFAAGQVTQIIYVPVYRRFLAAQDLTVNMTISTPTANINLITPAAVGTIHDLALVALPFSSKKKATYTDYLTDPVSVSLHGPGTGNVIFIGNTSNNTNAFEIVVDGATPATSLSVSVRGGKQTSFQNILVSSSIGSIMAKSANVLGLITIAGSLNNLTANYLAGVNLTVGAGTGQLSLNLGQSVGTTITSAIPIASLTALAFLSNSSTPVNLSAPSIGTIRIKGAFASTVVQTGSIGSVTVGTSITGVSLMTIDSIGPITAKGIANSIFFAGMSNTLTTLPTASTDFENKSASIASVRSTANAGFSNTLIAAWRIGSVNIGKITTANSGTPFGVSGDQIASVIGSGLAPIHLVNVNDATPPLIQGDFTVRPF